MFIKQNIAFLNVCTPCIFISKLILPWFIYYFIFYEQINLFLYAVVNTGSCILKRKKKPLQKKINYNLHFETQSPGYWLHGRGGTGWDPGNFQGLGIAEMWAE